MIPTTKIGLQNSKKVTLPLVKYMKIFSAEKYKIMVIYEIAVNAIFKHVYKLDNPS